MEAEEVSTEIIPPLVRLAPTGGAKLPPPRELRKGITPDDSAQLKGNTLAIGA